LFSKRLQKQAFDMLIIREYSLSLVIPIEGYASKNTKSEAASQLLAFFLFSKRLQKQAFDALENKKSQPKG
jgi:hypothetical protein